MSFVIRGVREEDLGALFDLARQFSLLNLPADKRIISEKIEKSIASFSGERAREDSVYMFIVEDLENGVVAGCSQVKAKHGTIENPTYSFKILKKERFSRDLGIGFIHQILRLKICTDGPTEVGGLIVDKSYRRRPEKVGRLASLNRFLFIGMNLDKFEGHVHAEMAPPLTDEGRSEFWEALGRRFTGMPYQEADTLSTQNKEFIRSLFPQEDIYLCLLDSRARLVIGRVGADTMAAQHMLEKIGFRYKGEIDPFDGGPHLDVKTKDVVIIKKAKYLKLVEKSETNFVGRGLFGVMRGNDFVSGASAYHLNGDEIVLPAGVRKDMKLEYGESLYFYAETEQVKT